MNTIVVIMQGRVRKIMRSYHADNERQAGGIVAWLRDSEIRAIAVGGREWDHLPDRCE
jgi:hypothetical protein